jgi:heptosyltransferase-2
VLIVKLGAMGDVLRTTALLDDIAARHAGEPIVWLTKPESLALLDGHPLLERAISTDDAETLDAIPFAAVYAFDSDPEGLAYAARARAERYYGFVAGAFGTCVGVAPGGDPTLYRIGLFDDLKRANERSYLEMLAAAAGLSYGGARPRVALDPVEDERARGAFASLPRPLVGVNADASERWERKRWNVAHVERLVEMAAGDGIGIALLGDADSHERNRALAKRFPGTALAFESSGNVRRLEAGIANCDLLLTGDTLAMHVGWGLGVPIVALFGPTSSAEIDLAAGDRKLAATGLACLGCYLKTCAVDPHCMDLLTPEIVYEAVRSAVAP